MTPAPVGRRFGSGALVRSADGRVLLVKPTYKPGWEIPGGVVEEGESPRACCPREIDEELGLDLAVGPLLVVDWLPALGSRSGADGILFVFDGGIVDDDQLSAIQLPSDELSEWRLVEVDDLHDYLRPGMARRVATAARAAAGGMTAYTEWGDPVRHVPALGTRVVVRRARRAEAREMAEVQLRAAVEGYSHIFPSEAPRPTLDELTAMWSSVMSAGEGAALAADDGRRVIGTAVAARDTDDPECGFLARLYVEPAWWGRGVGVALYEAAMDELRSAGHPRAGLWVLEKNGRARAMYERRGWRLVPDVVKPTWRDIVDVRYEIDL